jgi:hypothetical protein
VYKAIQGAKARSKAADVVLFDTILFSLSRFVPPQRLSREVQPLEEEGFQLVAIFRALGSFKVRLKNVIIR